ncbi:hypothetical protein ACWDRR_38565 [Kitasatospora sp. NPDC003701]
MFAKQDELPRPFENHDEAQDEKLESKAARKAMKKRRRTRRRAVEVVAYTGLGMVALTEPWALLLVVPALLLALRD